MHPLIGVVVLTWNNFDDTNECLQSLARLTYPNFRTFVVDNGSTDDSLPRLRRAWEPGVTFIALRENTGCPGGYNAGIRAALATGAEYVAVLNNDLVVSPDLLQTLLNGMDTPETVGAVGPIIVYYDHPDKVWCGGGVYNRTLGYTRHVGLDSEVPSWAKDQRTAVWPADYVNGCCVLISRKALEDVGLFDERLFLYLDEVDWCVRAWSAGYACKVVGRPLVSHKVSASTGVRGSSVPSGLVAYYMARNSFRVGRKHVRGIGAPVFIFGQLFFRLPHYVLGMALLGRWSSIGQYWQGTLDGLRFWVGGR